MKGLSKILSEFRRNHKGGFISLIFILILIVQALIIPFIANDKPIFAISHEGDVSFPVLNQRSIHHPDRYQFSLYPPIQRSPSSNDLSRILEGSSWERPLGTDNQGRCNFIRILYGTRVSIAVGFISVGIALIIGTIIGAVAGYYGGKLDIVISRIIEIVMCFPSIFLILSIIAFVGPGLFNIMVVIGLVGWTGIARLVRGEFLRIRNLDYIVATKALGFSDIRIIFKHILPNVLTPIFISATFGVAGAILTESTLSFLGLGVQPPTPSWGSMLNAGREYITLHPMMIFWPGLAIFLTVTAYNLLGDSLQDILNPKKEKKF